MHKIIRIDRYHKMYFYFIIIRLCHPTFSFVSFDTFIGNIFSQNIIII